MVVPQVLVQFDELARVLGVDDRDGDTHGRVLYPELCGWDDQVHVMCISPHIENWVEKSTQSDLCSST